MMKSTLCSIPGPHSVLNCKALRYNVSTYLPYYFFFAGTSVMITHRVRRYIQHFLMGHSVSVRRATLLRSQSIVGLRG